MVLTGTLPFPTETPQTYSWNGRAASTIGENGAETVGAFVAPGVYEVKISVVRDPSAATPETVAEATHQITVFKVDFTSVTLPNANPGTTDGVSFTASTASTTTPQGENEIVCAADIKPDSLDATYNPQIEWELQDNPDVTGDSGDPDDTETGTNVTLTVVAPAAPSGRNFRLNYRIQASLEITEGTKTYRADPEWKPIQQDERDYLRQQYMDMPTGTGAREILPPPRVHQVVGNRNRIRGLVDRGAYIPPADEGTMSFDELNCNGDSREPNHYPHTMQWDNTVSTGFQLVRDEHNQARIPDPANPGSEIDNPYRGIIWVTSTYRCPIWNRHEGGDPASRHMAGDAFDWDNVARGTVVDTSQNWTESRRKLVCG